MPTKTVARKTTRKPTKATAKPAAKAKATATRKPTKTAKPAAKKSVAKAKPVSATQTVAKSVVAIARAIKSGTTMQDIKAEYGVAGIVVRKALAEAGYSSKGEKVAIVPIAGTGQVLAKRVAAAREAGDAWWTLELRTGKTEAVLRTLLDDNGYGALTDGRVSQEEAPAPKRKPAAKATKTKAKPATKAKVKPRSGLPKAKPATKAKPAAKRTAKPVAKAKATAAKAKPAPRRVRRVNPSSAV